MSYTKPSAGGSFSDSPAFSAGFYADAIDVIGAHKRGELGNPVKGRGRAPTSDQVLIRNDTNLDLDRGHVVTLGAYVLDTDNKNFRQPWFEGNLVAEPAFLRYAVTVEPIPDGKFGRVQVSGVCLAKVNVIDVDHKYCRPKVGSAGVLQSEIVGPIELLEEPDSVDELDVFVRLACGLPVLLAKTTAAWSANNSYTTYEVYEGTKGSETAVTYTSLPNVYTRADIADDLFIKLTWMDRGLEAEPLECEL